MQCLRDEIARHLPAEGNARRLFHGRGRCFPGYEDVTVDAYPPLVLVTLHRPRPQAWLDELVALFLALPQPPVTLLLQERFRAGAPSRVLWGALPAELDAREAGLRYRLRLGEAQNIGFFPDMAVGRALVRERAEGRKVLNLFAYSCGFSVAALAGGAASVVNLDMNRGALALGRCNHELNALDLRRASFLALEFFRSRGRLRKLGPFDLVICDPPASQGASFTAARHWPKLVRSLPGLVASGGEVLACLNAPDLGPAYLEELFDSEFPAAEKLEIFRPGEDFPEADDDAGVTLHRYRVPVGG